DRHHVESLIGLAWNTQTRMTNTYVIVIPIRSLVLTTFLTIDASRRTCALERQLPIDQATSLVPMVAKTELQAGLTHR
ncbi:MAG: hypothetical protein JW759_02890, partial [Candidatus Coatesbacteria bacterium]|nr:hypothetical protein [Candidatus Coatesbacteria bacterium]